MARRRRLSRGERWLEEQSQEEAEEVVVSTPSPEKEYARLGQLLNRRGLSRAQRRQLKDRRKELLAEHGSLVRGPVRHGPRSTYTLRSPPSGDRVIVTFIPDTGPWKSWAVSGTHSPRKALDAVQAILDLDLGD